MNISKYYMSIPTKDGKLDYIAVHPELSRFWSNDFILVDNTVIPVTSSLLGKYLSYNVVSASMGWQYNKKRKVLLAYTPISYWNSNNMVLPIKPSCLCMVLDNNIKYSSTFRYYTNGINRLYSMVMRSMYNLYFLMNEFIKCYIGYICLPTNSVLGISDIPELTYGISEETTTISSLFSELINLRTVSYNSMTNTDVINEFNLTLTKFRAINPIELNDPEYVVILNNSVYGHENDSDVSLILSQLNTHISQILPNAKIMNHTNIVNELNGVVITDLLNSYNIPDYDMNPVSRSYSGYLYIKPWSVGLYNCLVSLP